MDFSADVYFVIGRKCHQKWTKMTEIISFKQFTAHMDCSTCTNIIDISKRTEVEVNLGASISFMPELNVVNSFQNKTFRAKHFHMSCFMREDLIDIRRAVLS